MTPHETPKPGDLCLIINDPVNNWMTVTTVRYASLGEVENALGFPVLQPPVAYWLVDTPVEWRTRDNCYFGHFPYVGEKHLLPLRPPKDEEHIEEVFSVKDIL